MKRPVAIGILASFFIQIIPFPAWADPEVESQANEIIQINPDYQPKKGDLEFMERSQVGSRWTFKKMPRELLGSLKTSFWGWGGLAFGLGAGAAAGIYPLDDNIQDSFEPNAMLGKTTNDVINYLFAPYTIGGVSVLLWISGYASKHPKLELSGKTLTEALILSMAITQIGKLAFRRERPNGKNFSFPSGHATAAFSTAGVLTVFYGWKGGVPAYALASLVAVSRVDSYNHFVSDVLMGAVLGSVVGVGTALWHKRENNRLFFTPQVSHERATISAHYIF